MKTFLSFNAILFLTLIPIISSGQLSILNGTITNQKTGNIIQSVNILELNSGIGTISNAEGAFSLMLKPGKAELVITHPEFKEFSRKLMLKNDTTVAVNLVPIANLKSKNKNSDGRNTAQLMPKLK